MNIYSQNYNRLHETWVRLNHIFAACLLAFAVVFDINRIFVGGFAPYCARQADANGDGAFNIVE